jgi:erythromycin esterase
VSVVPSELEGRLHQLKTIDPDEPFDDLEPLIDIVGDARIVGLGESFHIVHEFYLAHDRILRFLHERLGFQAFVMESGWSESVRLTEWTLGGPGDLDDLVKTAITYGMGDCTEMRAQLTWMREHGVTYHGMDMVACLATPEPALDQAWPYLRRFDPEAESHFKERILPVVLKCRSDTQDVGRYAALDEADRNHLTTWIENLALYFDDRQVEMEAATSGADFAIARRHVELVRQFDALIRSFPDVPGGPTARKYADGRMRDRFMAENVAWILDQLGPDAKVVVRGANGHLQRKPVGARGPGGSSEIDLNRTAGYFLQHRFGSDYVPIAFSHRYSDDMAIQMIDPEPPAGSVEELFGQLGGGMQLLDLRGATLPGIHSVGRNPVYTRVDLPACFDAVVHIDKVRWFDGEVPPH